MVPRTDGKDGDAQQRGIDHLVLAVRDLERAAAAYRRLGFTLTPRALHPFGTANSLVQLDGNFIELLGVVDPERIVPADAAGFSFSDHNARFLEHREGLSMVVLESADARRDHAAFRAAGLRTYEPVAFSRQARQPDGGAATVAFTICFVIDDAHAQVPMFVCQQHFPENFWHAEYQRHDNGARQICEVTVIADRPDDLAPYYRGVFGAAAVSGGKGGLLVVTPRGSLRVIAPDRLAARYAGVAMAPPAALPCFAGYSVTVDDLNAAATLLRDRGVPFAGSDTSLRIAPHTAGGTMLELIAG